MIGLLIMETLSYVDNYIVCWLHILKITFLIADEVPKAHTPVPDTTTDKSKEYHWLCWPEPQTKEDIPLRSQTSLGFHRAPTPYGGGPGDDIEDRPSSVIPGYVFGDSEVSVYFIFNKSNSNYMIAIPIVISYVYSIITEV